MARATENGGLTAHLKTVTVILQQIFPNITVTENAVQKMLERFEEEHSPNALDGIVIEKSKAVSVKEAARLLSVHTNTIHRWLKSGTLPYSRITNKHMVRIPLDAIYKLGHGEQATDSQEGGAR